MLVGGVLARGLLGTGAKNNHLDSEFCRRAQLKILKSAKKKLKFDLAVKSSTTTTVGSCTTSVKLLDRSYSKVEFAVMNDFHWDIILSREFLRQRECVTFDFG